MTPAYYPITPAEYREAKARLPVVPNPDAGVVVTQAQSVLDPPWPVVRAALGEPPLAAARPSLAIAWRPVAACHERDTQGVLWQCLHPVVSREYLVWHCPGDLERRLDLREEDPAHG